QESLRSQYGEFLYQQGRYAELAQQLAEWVGRNPEGATLYKQYLSALIRANQVDKANALIGQWIKEGQGAGDLPPAVAGRLQAAVDLALGHGHNLSTNRIEERWLNPLAEVVLFFAKHPSQGSLSDHVMSQSLFQQTDECRRVRKTVAGVLTDE